MITSSPEVVRLREYFFNDFAVYKDEFFVASGDLANLCLESVFVYSKNGDLLRTICDVDFNCLVPRIEENFLYILSYTIDTSYFYKFSIQGELIRKIEISARFKVFSIYNKFIFMVNEYRCSIYTSDFQLYNTFEFKVTVFSPIQLAVEGELLYIVTEDFLYVISDKGILEYKFVAAEGTKICGVTVKSGYIYVSRTGSISVINNQGIVVRDYFIPWLREHGCILTDRFYISQRKDEGTEIFACTPVWK